MKKKSFIFIFLLCFLFSINLIGQTIKLSQIKVTKTYSDFLDAVFLDIGKTYNVKFSYDWYSIHQISFKGSFNNAPLDSVLNSLCNRYNLKYHFDDDIIEIEKINDESTSGVTENANGLEEYTDKKIYFGSPKLTNFTLSGKIRDENTGEALPFATVGIPGTAVGAITNTDGYFTLLKVPSDTSTLTISYMGYKTRRFYLSPETQRENLIIELLPASTTLSAVEIKGEKVELMRVATAEISTVKLSPQKIATLPNIGEKDIMRSFQLMPGIASSNETSSGLYVRGGTPDQNLILYDGFTVYQVDHLYGFFSAFNSNAIKDIQLYKGGYEAKFGGRLSSVTEITAKEGNQKKFNLGGDISLLSANLFTEFPLGKKITVFIAGRKSYKGPLYNKIFKKFNTQSTETESNAADSRMPQGTASTLTSFFYDLNSKITFKPTTKDIITLSIYNGTDKLDNSKKMSTPPGLQGKGIDLSSNSSDITKYGNLGGALKWSRRWSDKLYGNTIFSYSNYYSKRNRTDNMAFKDPSGNDKNVQSGTIENNNLKDYSFKSDYQWDIIKNNKIEFGAFSTYNDIHYSFSQNDTSTYLNRQDYGSISGGYVQDNIKLFDSKVSIIPGARVTYFNVTNKVYSEPRFSINYNLTDKIQLKFATGKYYQFINRVIREDIMTGSRDFWILSDGNKVPVGEATHLILGTSYDTKNILYSVEAYYKDLKGLTEYSIRFKPQMGGGGYSENFFNGTGIAKGIEFLAQKKSGNLNGWVSYTLGTALDHFSVYSDKYFPAAQDVTHEFKIVSMYKWKRWDFSATWIYATGRPYTAPEGGYQLTLLDGNSSNYITVGDKNSLRLPDYHRMDISANYNFINYKKKAVGYIGFSIFNVYARKNVWYKEYTIVDGYVIVSNVYYLGFTPNVTLSFKLR